MNTFTIYNNCELGFCAWSLLGIKKKTFRFWMCVTSCCTELRFIFLLNDYAVAGITFAIVGFWFFTVIADFCLGLFSFICCYYVCAHTNPLCVSPESLSNSRCLPVCFFLSIVETFCSFFFPSSYSSIAPLSFPCPLGLPLPSFLLFFLHSKLLVYLCVGFPLSPHSTLTHTCTLHSPFLLLFFS